jgi:hypothetical protein
MKDASRKFKFLRCAVSVVPAEEMFNDLRLKKKVL